MNTFTWLVIGHFVGDWMLQNDWMAQGKKRGRLTRPGLTHFAIYTITIMSTIWLSGTMKIKPSSFTILGALVFISHWAIDALDAAGRWMRLFRQTNLEIVRLVVDQMLHLLVLVLLTVFFDA